MAKGSGNGCCCNGCEEMPFTADRAQGVIPNPGVPVDQFSFPGYPIDLTQAFCCSCLPKAACITLTCGYKSVTGAFKIKCNLTSGLPNGTGYLYQGELTLAGDVIDFLVYITVIESQCYLGMESYALGIHGDLKPITSVTRGSPQYFCRTLTANDLNIGLPYPPPYDTEWYGNSSCGPVTVTLRAEDLTPITRRKPCTTAGLAVPDTDLIKNVCLGCGCVCTNACISIQYPKHNTVISGSATIIDGAWTLSGGPYSYGVRVRVVAADEVTKACALSLEADHGFTFQTPPTVQLINGQCPHPSATWTANDQDGDPVIVRFACSDCSDCSKTPSNAACCNGDPLPRVVHCTIDRGDANPTVSCNCLPVTIPMIFVGGASPFWSGILKVGDPLQWCGPGGTHDIVLQLTCGPPWTLTFGSEGAFQTPCADTVSNPTATCDPLHLVFTYVSQCCGMGGPASLIFTVTE